MAQRGPQPRDVTYELLEAVDHYINLFTAHAFPGTPVAQVLEDARSPRGKMVRPRLVLLSATFGPRYLEHQDRLCKLAAMVELTHMASLIHDDIVDDAAYRRGKPSLQEKYGKEAAVYAGDFLMSRISYYIASEEMTRSGEILSKAVEEMCVGEIGQAQCRYQENVTLESYFQNIHGKTAALFMAACRIGALESRCDTETAGRLEEFGECLGMLFQLRDDLLDFTSNLLTIGKGTHKDFQEGIYTMPVLWALGQPMGREKLLPMMKENRVEPLTGEQLYLMERVVVELGGVEATKQEIRALCNRAKSILSSCLPQNETSLPLLAMLHELGAI